MVMSTVASPGSGDWTDISFFHLTALPTSARLWVVMERMIVWLVILAGVMLVGVGSVVGKIWKRTVELAVLSWWVNKPKIE